MIIYEFILNENENIIILLIIIFLLEAFTMIHKNIFSRMHNKK